MWLIITAVLLAIVCLIQSAVILFVGRFAYKMANTVLNVEKAVNTSLDLIDERFASISKILEIPVFFDSREIRQVLADIELTRSAILYVANALSGSVDPTSVIESFGENINEGTEEDNK